MKARSAWARPRSSSCWRRSSTPTRSSRTWTTRSCKEFYEDKQGAAFQAQLFFLLSRHRQLQELAHRDLFHQITLCDYIFPKDKIFAYLNLDDSELLIYDKLYAMLEEQVVEAGPGDLPAGRDARRWSSASGGRNRDYEIEISEAYINEVNKAYNYFFFHYTQTPLLVIDTTSIDFVHHEEHLDELVEQIRKMDRGVQYYRPLGSYQPDQPRGETARFG